MAKIRYRRIPEPSLIDLNDEELKVLDLALADYRDKLGVNVVGEHERYHRAVADTLHDQVLLIKAGEDLSEE
jgi:hypothetical protein